MHLFLKRGQLDQLAFGDAVVHRTRLTQLLRPRVGGRRVGPLDYLQTPAAGEEVLLISPGSSARLKSSDLRRSEPGNENASAEPMLSGTTAAGWDWASVAVASRRTAVDERAWWWWAGAK